MDVERVELGPGRMVGVHEVVAVDALTDFFGRAFTAAAAEMGRLGVRPEGAAMAFYTGDVTATVDVVAGFPVTGTPAPHAPVVLVDLPSGPAVVTVHTGTYDAMHETYDALMRWVREQGLTPGERMWEEYLVGPDTEPTDPSRWRTRIVLPVTALRVGPGRDPGTT